MEVNILSHTPDAIQVAFTAIRTCYSPHDQDKIWYEDFYTYKEKNNDHIRLIKQIVSHGHTSTLEHISFTFAISGVSRSLLAQLTRHRIGFSYSVQSQRYVKQANGSRHGGFNYITPPEILHNPEALKDFKQIMEDIQNTYDWLIIHGVKAEDARFVLPNAATTNITLTVNLRAFIDFWLKRNDRTHTQWELARLAMTMQDEIINAEPWIEHVFDAITATTIKEDNEFDFRTLFVKKFVRLSGNLETTEEMVWKDGDSLYTLEQDGSFNRYQWQGFIETLTPRQMKKKIEEYYERS